MATRKTAGGGTDGANKSTSRKAPRDVAARLASRVKTERRSLSDEAVEFVQECRTLNVDGGADIPISEVYRTAKEEYGYTRSPRAFRDAVYRLLRVPAWPRPNKNGGLDG